MPELDSRLEFVVDSESESIDFEKALAQFLIRFVRSEALADPTSPAEAQSST